MPIEQTGNAITFYAFYTNAGAGALGLAVTADVWEVEIDGTATELQSAAAATEIGDGLYRYILASGSVDAEGEYLAVFKTAGVVDQAHMAAIWSVARGGIENLNAAIGSVPDAVWDEVLEGALTGRQIIRIILAVLAGISTGGGTTSVAFRDNADSKDRVAATVTAAGNRTAVTLDGT